MSPPAAWKRRLRCGLVGSWVLMRNGLRRASATVSSASSFAARMAAGIAACCQRLRRRVLWMQCSGQGVSFAVLRGARVGGLQRSSVLRDASSDYGEAAQTRCKQPRRATACHRIRVPYRSPRVKKKQRSSRVICSSCRHCTLSAQRQPRANGKTPSPH